MQAIGTIEFVQIQQSPMKTFINDTDRVYHPHPLLTIAKLHLTLDGIMGLDANDEQIIDVHHVAHPQSRYRGDNKISLGFIGHYDSMRQRFGDHMENGVGGENIIVRANSTTPPDISDKRVFIRSADDTLIELRNVIPAPPCREFSIFCHQRDVRGGELKDTLQWLDNGRRGFYAELVENDCDCYVAAGDTIFVA